MNYYPFHIGDFRSGTVNMSRQSRWIYRDMLDVYYDSEKPLSLDLDVLCDLIGAETDEERRIVERLLRFKFIKSEDGYRQETCVRVIAEYHKKAVVAQTNGRLGGRPKKATAIAKEPSGLQSGSDPVPTPKPVETISEANQEPITNNHTNAPIPPKGGSPARKKTGSISFPEFLEKCKAEDVLPVPADCAVFDYAAKAGIPEDFLRLQWLEFRDRYSEPGAKKYSAWTSVFCKSVRGNWFRLWYSDSAGSYALTTAGMQAKNNHEGSK